MLWLKLVSALESALLLASPTTVLERPRHRARRDPASATSAAPRPAGAPQGEYDPATGAGLLHAVEQAGPTPPGWGLTERFPPAPYAPYAPITARAFRTKAASTTPRTVWSHDLAREANALTGMVWQQSRQTLGDARWTSAGVAAWWGLRHAMDTHEAGALLHRARSLAYGLFETPGHPLVRWTDLGDSERRILKMWILTRTALIQHSPTPLPAFAARSVLTQVAETVHDGVENPAMLEALYLLVMADDLALRHDLDAIRKQDGAIWNPSLALGMSAYFRDLLLPPVESLAQIDALPVPVQRGIDEAALLYFTIERDARHAWSVACMKGEASRATLRSAFVARMPGERRDRELLEQLFAPTNVPGRVHYDGLTLRNALGRTFEDVLNGAEITDLPGADKLTTAHRRKLLFRKYAQLRFSTRHPFGSVRHAIATTVERAALHRDEYVPEGLDTDVGLLNALKDARRAWDAQDTGPVSPDLLLAGLLAGSNLLRLETMATLNRLFESAIIVPFRRASDHMRATGLTGKTPIEWLMAKMERIRDEGRPIPATGLPPDYAWAIDRIRDEREKIFNGNRPYWFLEAMSDHPVRALGYPKPIDALKSQCYERAFRNVDVTELEREILVGETWQERGQASLAYANERIFATFGPVPTLDISALATEALRNAGLNDTEIHAIRHIELEGSDAELREPITGSFLDAFLHVCRQVSAAQHFFLPSGQAIHPLTIVVPAIDAFNARLPDEPWIVLAAKETFRGRGVVPSPSQLRQAIDEQLRRHRVPTVASLMLKQIFDVRNLIPVYASSQAIYQGLTEKRYHQVMFGVISMTGEFLAIFRPYTGTVFARPLFAAVPRTAAVRRGSIATVADGVSAFCSWPPSFSAFKNLKPWQELTNPPERLFDADLRLVPVHNRRPVPPLSDEALPWGARRAVARARAGKTDIVWNDFLVVFCPRENTTFLGRYETEDRYIKIDWLTLQPVEPPQFVQRGEDGEFRSIETLPPVIPPLLDGSLLNDRPTVQQVTALLRNATDAAPRDFQRLFEQHFDVEYTADARAFQRDHPSRGYDLLALLADAYTHSAILRRVFHHFVDTSPARDAIPVLIDCAVLPSTAVSQTVEGKVTSINAVTLPADRDDATLRYQSVRGIETPALMRTILHEFLHAWTSLPDPDLPHQRHHRGGVVWFAEAVLRQMEHPVHPRIAYGVWDERVAASSMTYRDTILWAGLEDRLIEQAVPDLRMFDGLTTAYGTPVEQRATVAQTLSALRPAPASADGAAPAFSLASSLESTFVFLDARTDATPMHQKQFGEDVRAFVAHCEAHSPLLRRLIATTQFNATQPWHFRRDTLTSTHDDVRQLYEVNCFARRITVFYGTAHYLSHGGLRAFRSEICVMDAMVALLIGETAASRQGSLYLDRGAVVWLTDHILEEGGYDVAKRLNRAVLFENYGTHYRSTLNEFARARWAVEVEDRYIAAALG